MPATLESTRGSVLGPRDLDGRVTVVFYEARGHTEHNEALKRACARMLAPGRPLALLGVADLHGLGRVRTLVRPAVRAMAARYGAELYLDFDGVLRDAPYRLRGGGAEVAILDVTGARVHYARGRLDARDVDRFFDALGEALSRAGAPLPSAA